MRKYKTKFVLLLWLLCSYSCDSKRNITEIAINNERSVYFITYRSPTIGGRTSVILSSSDNEIQDSCIIDFGDWAETPILYRIKDDKLKIFIKRSSVVIPDCFDEYISKEFDSIFKYINIMDSIEYYRKDGYEIFFPFPSIMNKYR